MTMSAKQAAPLRLGAAAPPAPPAPAPGAASPCSASLSLGASQPLPPLDPEQYNHDSLLALAAKYDGPATHHHKVRARRRRRLGTRAPIPNWPGRLPARSPS